MSLSKDYGSIPTQEPEATDKVPQGPPPPQSRVSSRGLLFALFGGTLFVLVWLAYSDKFHGVRTGTNTASHTNSTTHDIERFYKHQRVDHFSDSQETYAQRYFEDTSFFQGPGHPIFVVVGGEAPVEQIIYPWVSRVLAKTYGGLTVCIEHRFYGASQPVDPAVVTNADFYQLLHPRQALADAAHFIQHLQRSLGCGPRGSPDYCPVMTIGGSYPGFLSVLMRTVYSDVVDIGWGSSAPLYLYSHAVSDSVYFDKITSVAEAYSPGCTAAVRNSLTDFQTALKSSDKTPHQVAADIGVCPETIPSYIDNPDTLQEETIMIIAEHFAENNMDFYPPGPDQPFVKGCRIFQRDDMSSYEKVSSFLRMRKGSEECFDLASELPPGPEGTISAADWSGVGGGHDGLIWDYQSCTLIPECSFSSNSLFPPRKWTLEWLTDHCERRFDYTPHLQDLVEEFGFDDLSNDSHIILTNGKNDGWFALSIVANVSDTIKTFNFPNGAHHSDLTHYLAPDQNTPDIVDGHKRVTALVGSWFDEIMQKDTSTTRAHYMF